MQRPDVPADPYRVLGLEHDAPMSEVKRAYRRLAKETHPDAAGPATVRRFLLIQAAYQAILAGAHLHVGEDAGTPRGWRRTPRPAPRRARPAGQRPGGPSADPAPGEPEPAGPSKRTAHLGSTSYDDAPLVEPDWEGGSWYGTSSGTYWTVNPREYADPRKHGPEYQSRGRPKEPEDR